MTHEIRLTATARGDVQETVNWLRAERSAAAAEHWLDGLRNRLEEIAGHPERHPLAAESDKFPTPVREALYGKGRRGKYRILYQIAASTIYVIHVRHSARDEIEP